MKNIIRIALILAVLFPFNSVAKDYDFTTYKAYDSWWRAMSYEETNQAIARVIKNYKYEDYYYIRSYTLSGRNMKQFKRCNKMLKKVDAIVNKSWFETAKCNYINTPQPGIILSIKQLANSNIVAYHALDGQRGLVPASSLVSVSKLGRKYFNRIMQEHKDFYLREKYISN